MFRDTLKKGLLKVVGASVILAGLVVGSNSLNQNVNAATTTSYATVTKKGYSVWSNLSWSKSLHSTSNWYHHSFKVTSKSVKNGNIYYKLSYKNQNFGYLNASATKLGKGEQGAAISANQYVTLSKKGYTVWGNFAWTKKSHSTSNWYRHTFQVKTIYYHSNGSTYYSLYQNGKWFGYLNASATSSAKSAQGAAVSTNKYVSLSKKGYTVWGNFSWSKKQTSTSSLYGKTYQVKTMYYHSNGSTYLSLYRNGKWVGYLSSNATKSSSRGNQTVYIAPNSGKHYHFDAKCRGLRTAKSVKSVKLSAAEANKYTLCGYED